MHVGRPVVELSCIPLNDEVEVVRALIAFPSKRVPDPENGPLVAGFDRGTAGASG